MLDLEISRELKQKINEHLRNLCFWRLIITISSKQYDRTSWHGLYRLNKFRIKRAKFDRMDFEAKYTKKSDNSSRTSPRAGILANHIVIYREKFLKNGFFEILFSRFQTQFQISRWSRLVTLFALIYHFLKSIQFHVKTCQIWRVEFNIFYQNLHSTTVEEGKKIGHAWSAAVA